MVFCIILWILWYNPLKGGKHHETRYRGTAQKYIENPPEGMTSRDIRHMSEEELLDMDYFLNDDELDDDFGEEGFYIF